MPVETTVARWNAAHRPGQTVRVDYTGASGAPPSHDVRHLTIARLLSKAWVALDGSARVTVTLGDNAPGTVPLSRGGDSPVIVPLSRVRDDA